MIRSYLPSLAVLAAMLAFSLWCGASAQADAQRWQTQLEQAEQLASQEDWSGAAEALSAGYRDWSSRQFRLHIIQRHDILSAAEAMYCRALAFASAEEESEFRAELADLRTQLRILSEAEQFDLKNIL